MEELLSLKKAIVILKFMREARWISVQRFSSKKDERQCCLNLQGENKDIFERKTTK